MKNNLLLLLLITLFVACGTTEKIVKESVVNETPKYKYDETFDPLTLNDDDIVIEKLEKQIDSKLEKPVDVQEKQNLIIGEVDGYRVQLLATRSIESATLIKQKAEEQFLPYNHKVYWSFEAPFYKIRIGDVLKRSEAEAIRDLAKQLGYDQAFPVRSKIVPPANQM